MKQRAIPVAYFSCRISHAGQVPVKNQTKKHFGEKTLHTGNRNGETQQRRTKKPWATQKIVDFIKERH